MAVEEGLFRIVEEGERLFYRFQPGSREKNPLLLIHGHGEHSGRYLKFFDRLRDLEIPMAAFDLRGCGRSSGAGGDVERFEDYLSDLNGFLSFLEKKHGLHAPYQVFGQSLGGLIALAWSREQPDRVSKLILSSPLLGLPQEGLIRIAISILNPLLPRWVIHNPVYPPFLTHDPEEVRIYRNDPLIRRMITVRLVHEMLKYAALFREGKVSVRFPVYLLMAEKDLVVRSESSRDFYARLEAPDKALEVFKGCFHEIFNETGQDRIFERLRHYLGR